MRFDRGVRATQHSPEPAFCVERDRVVGELAGGVLVALVAHHVGQVLDEVTAARDVQRLRAAAHGQHRHVPCEGAAQERELGPVPLAPRRVGRRMRLGAVQRRVEIGAAGDDECVEQVEVRLGVGLGRRQHDRPAARVLDGGHVRGRDQHDGLVPDAELRRHRGVARDADDRPDLPHTRQPYTLSKSRWRS